MLMPKKGSLEAIVLVKLIERGDKGANFIDFKDHPEISGFKNTGVPEDEGQHLQSVYQPAMVLGGPGLFGFKPASNLNETSPLVSLV